MIVLGIQLNGKKIMTVFEMERSTEVFKLLRKESPLSLLNTADNHLYYNRRNQRECYLSPTVGMLLNRNRLKIDYSRHTTG